ncbi:MAG TPA: VWA domain-containing protein [Phototrophicaceae bacterium]|nr:VWA domain-containing protein [Phototrophicaceae bacterium]
MTFIWPPMLILLLLIPLFIWGYWRMQRQRRQLLAQYGNLTVTSGKAPRLFGLRRHLPPLFFLAALTIIIIALARPEAVVGVPRIEGTVILTFDISGSMAAEDLEPTRLEAAKDAAADFVLRQPPTVQIGVVAFSDTGLAVQQPTYNQDDVLSAIRRLGPSQGTSLGNGMLISLNVIDTNGQEITNYYSSLTPEPTLAPTPVPRGTYTANAIVLLTDGENTVDPDPLEAAQAAADRGVRVYTIGIGSPTGTILNIEGFNVFTQLNEPLLQQIAQRTGGNYFNAESREELLDIYQNLNRQFVIKPEPMEITPILAGLSILALLLGGALSLVWFGRLP